MNDVRLDDDVVHGLWFGRAATRDLPAALEDRLRTLRALLVETTAANDRARPHLSLAETHALQHREHRLRAEIDWHAALVADLPAVVADERARALTPDPHPAHPEDRSHD